MSICRFNIWFMVGPIHSNVNISRSNRQLRDRQLGDSYVPLVIMLVDSVFYNLFLFLYIVPQPICKVYSFLVVANVSVAVLRLQADVKEQNYALKNIDIFFNLCNFFCFTNLHDLLKNKNSKQISPYNLKTNNY